MWKQKCNFSYQKTYKDEVYKTLLPDKAVKKVWISLYWTIRKYMHACWLIIDVEDKQLFDFNYILLNNIFCNNDYICKWKVDVTAECRICKDIKTCKHLIYEFKKYTTNLEIFN